MTRVLFVGQQPETVDFTDPVLPPGMNAQIGDRIAFNGIHRDPNAACSYIPPLLTSDAGPAAQATPAGGPVSPKP